MFDIHEMTCFAVAAIKDFAAKHPHETFYSFAIDANMLCLNSEEQFAETLAKYQKSYPEHYSSDDDVRDLKKNTGDWAYQGFAELDASTGFDADLYDAHYELASSSEEGHAPDSSYAQAMTTLISELGRADAFAPLKRSQDFVATWVDHNY